ATLKNTTGQDVDGVVRAVLKTRTGNISLSKKTRVGARSSAQVEFSSNDFPQLNIRHPDLWWPYPLGPQNLQNLEVSFETEGQVSDQAHVTFGIREITSELDAQHHRLFKINGRNILIRGGGWTQDMLMRVDDEREDQELRYAQEMNLNTIRLE